MSKFPFSLAILCATTIALQTLETAALAEGGHGSLHLRSSDTKDKVEGSDKSKASPRSSDKDFGVELTTPHMVPELHKPKPEAPDVLETVKTMAKAAARCDIEQYKACLDDSCTVFDESNNKMLSGKDAAVDAMVKEFDRDKNGKKHRTVSIKIDQPFVKVAGNSAVVSYHGEKTITFDGEKPVKREAFVTQVFIKDGDNWKLSSHTRGQWTESPTR